MKTKTNNKVIWLFASALAAVIIALLLVLSFSACSSNDAENVKTAYKNYLLENTNTSKVEAKSIEDIKKDLEVVTIDGIETYREKNTDYKTDDQRAKWPAAQHVNDLLSYAITSEKNGNSELRDIAVKLTYYWVFNNFRNTNWWQNDLGVRNNLASAGMFIYDDLNEKGRTALMGMIHDATFKYHESLKTHLGANLFDYADVSIKCAAIESDNDAFNEAFNRMQDEIVTGNKEGFQTDGSFFQHGKQIQIASYGKSIIRLGKLLKICNSAGKTFKNEKMDIIANYITKGLTCTTHKGYTNYAAVSREYTRQGNLDAKNNNYSQLSYYLDVDNCPNKDGIQNFIDSVKDKKSTFNGLQFFDIAKLITMNIDDVYISYKGTDNTMTNTECVNEENCLGLNLSYGTNTTVMDTGKEYYDISPYWQYDYLPGTTSIGLDEGKEDTQINDIVQGTNYYSDSLYEKLLPSAQDGDNVYGGGYDQDNNVACLMEKTTHHDENNLTVTCFACEDGMVLVGSDLEYTGQVTGSYFGTPRTLHTTLEQCNYNGSHNLSADNKTLTHGNVVYKSLDDNNIVVNVADQTGTWQRNNPQLTKPVGDVTGKVLTAYFDYGSNKADHYAYCIQPATRQDKEFKVIDTSDSKIHAVKLPNGKVMAAFYTDGSFTYDGQTYSGQKGEYKVF